MSQRPQDLHHRPPGRPHRLPPQVAGHEPPTNAEGVKAVLRGIRGPIDAAKQGKTPATAGLATEHGDLLAGFARDGILDRQRLRRIGLGLGSQYVLLPGLAQFSVMARSRLAASEAARLIELSRMLVSKKAERRSSASAMDRVAAQPVAGAWERVVESVRAAHVPAASAASFSLSPAARSVRKLSPPAPIPTCPAPLPSCERGDTSRRPVIL